MILLAAHILICAAIWLASRYGALKTTAIVMPIVIFVPFWGAACVLMLHFGVLRGERIPLDYDRLEMTDEIYSAISVSQSDDGQDVVPMEEALLLDSPKQCREMILDMLMDNPERYLPQFQQIRSADDVEAVHYATTIMVEIGKRYEMQWQKLNRYIELLDTRFARKPELQYGVELAENLMTDGNFTRAGEILEIMASKWPRDGEVWMALLRYYICQQQGDKIQQVIAHIDEQGIALSAHERETVAFWRS